jgi:nucleotide-binding universal stress UspA family protein
MGAARGARAGRWIMNPRLLVAVEDSATGLETAAVAVELAAELGGCVLAVHVLGDGHVEAALRAGRSHDEHVVEARGASSAALLHHVVAHARRAGVAVETRRLEGHPAARILEAAREWSAGMVVIGRSGRTSSGPHYVGAQTRHVLEFSEVPVLVVPLPDRTVAAPAPFQV